jgi:uncharacterized protein (DUF433 family)
MSYRDIITIDPNRRGGKPCIRQTQIAVYDVLGWLADGMSIAEMIDSFPGLTKTDTFACLKFAADRGECALATPKGDEQLLMLALQKPESGSAQASIASQPLQAIQPQSRSKLYPIAQPFVWLEKRIWEPLLSWATVYTQVIESSRGSGEPPPNPPILGDFRTNAVLQSPPELGDLGGEKAWSEASLDLCVHSRLSWGENQALISLLGLLGNLGLLSAALTYIGLEEQRREAQVYLDRNNSTSKQCHQEQS